ncbi:transporter associated with antigen processing protein 1, partial [Striga asiatica]
VETARPASFQSVLTQETTCRDRNLKFYPNPILWNLIKIRPRSKIPPINTCIARAMPHHHSYRLTPLWIIRAALVFPRKPEAGAGVEAEWPDGPRIQPVSAGPHVWVCDNEVWVRVAYVMDWVYAGWSPELKLGRVSADEEVLVVWAATAVLMGIGPHEVRHNGLFRACVWVRSSVRQRMKMGRVKVDDV